MRNAFFLHIPRQVMCVYLFLRQNEHSTQYPGKHEGHIMH